MMSSPITIAQKIVAHHITEAAQVKLAIIALAGTTIAVIAKMHPGFGHGVKRVMGPPVSIIHSTCRFSGLSTAVLLGSFPTVTGTVVLSALGYGAYRAIRSIF